MFATMKTGTKVLAGFGIAIAITLVVGMVGYLGLRTVYDDGNDIAEVRLPSIDGLADMGRGMLGMEVGLRGLVNRRMTEPSVRQAQYDFIAENRKSLDEGYQQYEPLPKTPEEATQWKDFLPVWKQWQTAFEQVVQFAQERDRLLASSVKADDAKVAELDDRTFAAAMEERKSMIDADKRLDALILLNTTAAKEEADAADKAMSRTSVVSQADGSLSSVFRARRTFFKMSSAFATQTKPLGLAL